MAGLPHYNNTSASTKIWLISFEEFIDVYCIESTKYFNFNKGNFYKMRIQWYDGREEKKSYSVDDGCGELYNIPFKKSNVWKYFEPTHKRRKRILKELCQ